MRRCCSRPAAAMGLGPPPLPRLLCVDLCLDIDRARIAHARDHWIRQPCEPRRGLALLVPAGLGELRRAGRADRPVATRAGGPAPLALGTALPARPQLLHAAAGARGHAASHLPGLADARRARWPDRRGAVHYPLGVCAHGPGQRLCALGAAAAAGLGVRRAQTRGAGHRADGRLAHRPPNLAHAPAGGPGDCRFPGSGGVQASLSRGGDRRWPDRPWRRPLAAQPAGGEQAPRSRIERLPAGSTWRSSRR